MGESIRLRHLEILLLRARQLGFESDVQRDVCSPQARLLVAKEDRWQLEVEGSLEDPCSVQSVHGDRESAKEAPCYPTGPLLLGLPREGKFRRVRIEDADFEHVGALHHVCWGIGPLAEDDRQLGLLVPDRVA